MTDDDLVKRVAAMESDPMFPTQVKVRMPMGHIAWMHSAASVHRYLTGADCECPVTGSLSCSLHADRKEQP